MIERVVVLAAAALFGVRWLRVIQREHYLPGSLLAMARVWIRARPVNGLVALIPIACAVAAIQVDPLIPAIVAAAALAVFPLGLGLRGSTSHLAWTPRLRRLALIVVVLVAIGLAVMEPVYVIVITPLTLELGLLIGRPLERRLSQRFVDEAETTLRRVGPTVIGITGSYGKTSTKAYVRDLVSGTKRAIASPASYNNRLGLSRAINEHLTGDAEVFVAEMGTYGPGEIAEMVSWIHPEISVMTAIGPVHLERFKTEENIVAAKSEILSGARVGVINVDHPLLAALADRVELPVWRCGTTDAANDVRVTTDEAGHRIVVRGEEIGVVDNREIYAGNLACAIAVAYELGVAPDDVVARSRRLAPPAHRQTISTSEAGFTIIDDTFNANPAGASRALGVLAAHGDAGGRRVTVTPGMIEMGPRQDAGNESFARHAAEVGDVVIVGHTNRRALRKGTEGSEASVIVVDSRPDAVQWVRRNLGVGDVVLYENDLPDHYP